MPNIIMVGTQWGDEGKGKILDWLSSRADLIVRFQGGHNAGHTLVVDGAVYKLSLLPSGIIRRGKRNLIGNGVVFDGWAFMEEVERLRGQNIHISPDNLLIAENAALILPLHRQWDGLSNRQIGTTQRGIGPAYEDKVARRALRLADLTDLENLPQKMERLLAHHNRLRKGEGLPLIHAEDLLEPLSQIAPKLTPFIARSGAVIAEAYQNNQTILFEGAQGILLDVDHGTYPFVTSSNVVAGQAFIGAPAPLRAAHRVLGITKAYMTRVGEGPFPSEQDNDIGGMLGEKGAEFGTVTGRKRRCGWFDAVLTRYAVSCSGVDSIALTKLDVLDGFDELKICIGYDLDGKRIDYMPASLTQMEKLEPIYQSLEGWKSSTSGARDLADLPSQARAYIDYIADIIGVRIDLLSTSPERDDIIVINDPFKT